ncbi:hypothetical protein CRG98_033369 [Punica granatum]|uniref:Uncharacterized protein n=1 Tax=Punica granatum TaxID=22663 RepID=A0A2I0IQH0_PUNGR|nr:hypothetical protein CRG98_033369 [Punica granatum]
MANLIRQSIHIVNKTALISLLQPPLGTFELYYDFILLSEEKIDYQGPRNIHICQLFNQVDCEITAIANVKAYKSFHIRREIECELTIPFNLSKKHPAALARSKYGATAIIGIPVSMLEIVLHVLTAYYLTEFDSSVVRVLKQYVAYTLMRQMSFFRCMGTLTKEHVISNTAGCAGMGLVEEIMDLVEPTPPRDVIVRFLIYASFPWSRVAPLNLRHRRNICCPLWGNNHCSEMTEYFEISLHPTLALIFGILFSDLDFKRRFHFVSPVSGSFYGVAVSQYGNVHAKLDTGETAADYMGREATLGSGTSSWGTGDLS